MLHVGRQAPRPTFTDLLRRLQAQTDGGGNGGATVQPPHEEEEDDEEKPRFKSIFSENLGYVIACWAATASILTYLNYHLNHSLRVEFFIATVCLAFSVIAAYVLSRIYKKATEEPTQIRWVWVLRFAYFDTAFVSFGTMFFAQFFLQGWREPIIAFIAAAGAFSLFYQVYKATLCVWLLPQQLAMPVLPSKELKFLKEYKERLKYIMVGWGTVVKFLTYNHNNPVKNGYHTNIYISSFLMFYSIPVAFYLTSVYQHAHKDPAKRKWRRWPLMKLLLSSLYDSVFFSVGFAFRAQFFPEREYDHLTIMASIFSVWFAFVSFI